jgi:hypothetical protein
MYSVAKSMIAVFACTAASVASACKTGEKLEFKANRGYYVCVKKTGKLADEAVAKDNSLTCDSAGNCMLSDEL